MQNDGINFMFVNAHSLNGINDSCFPPRLFSLPSSSTFIPPPSLPPVFIFFSLFGWLEGKRWRQAVKRKDTHVHIYINLKGRKGEEKSLE